MVQRLNAGWAGLLGVMALPVAAQEPLLAKIFADHAVLQRDRPIAVWGTGTAGEEVTVTLGPNTQRARIDAQGRWRATLPAMAAGGPHSLTAHTPTRAQDVDDVLVGDVWLCSGQSNMEWTVRNALNADWEAAHSANDRIRHVAVPRDARVLPREDFAGALEWKVAGPATTKDFSAVCYYMVREIAKIHDVPQGMIHASWGGTRIETWLSADALRKLGGNDEKLALLSAFSNDAGKAAAGWAPTIEKWWTSLPAARGVTPWTAKRSGAWKRAPAQLGHWESWRESGLAEYDGIVWYRAKARLTRAQAKSVRSVRLGAIDDVDLVYVNGQPVGSGYGHVPREYVVPPGALKAGDNSVVINVYNMWGNGGVEGAPARHEIVLADGQVVPLTDWEYQVAPEGVSWSMPRAPWEPIAGINVLYNGMIAPLGKYGVRGVAWYQGEANGGLGDALNYEAQLRMLMADWRAHFEAPLSFFVVQLANWNRLATSPVDSGWARLRDAQRRAVAADGNAGLAVTIDIGNRDDIHPTNKQDVGKRLARAARRVVYGEKIPAGAWPQAVARDGAVVKVTLADANGKLRVIGSKDPSGFELCGADQASCRFVRASLDGNVVTLEDAQAATATRVRFCWADAPLCNLFDEERLPVGPFEVEVR
jgi:sialate O-acetylesterase